MSDYFDFHVKKELVQTALEAGAKLPPDVRAEVRSILEQDLVLKGFDRENTDEKTKKLADLYVDLHTGLFAMKWGIQTKVMKEIEKRPKQEPGSIWGSKSSPRSQWTGHGGE